MKRCIRISFVALTLAGILFSCSVVTPGSRPEPSASSPRAAQPPAGNPRTGSMESDILANINVYRQSKGLGALQMIDAATQQAYLHSQNMATGKAAFGHDGFDQRISNIGKSIGRVSAAAENVAYGSTTARQVVDGWLNSPPHKKNIEGNYTLTGIGVYANRQGVLYFTQVFVRQ